MCIVQRYAMTAMAVLALVGTRVNRLGLARGLMVVAIAVAGFGAFVAARQSWLQWYPPNTVSCGRDFYGMIEA